MAELGIAVLVKDIVGTGSDQTGAESDFFISALGGQGCGGGTDVGPSKCIQHFGLMALMFLFSFARQMALCPHGRARTAPVHSFS